jgi:drug/metabolite transporter (DMT)-like permease
MTQLSLGLTLAFISAIAVNWAYSREHDAAAAMPRFSPRRPLQFVSLLLRDRRWLAGFATETAGWLVYVAALRLAPISLVQAVCASGIAFLALASTHGHPRALARHEQLAVVIAVAGLVLLALSLVNTQQSDHVPSWPAAFLWLGASAAAAAVLALLGAGLARASALGLAAGLLFAGGDISAKLVVYGGTWLLAALALIVCYALGTSVLQGSFQHGDALTGAGLATLATNAVPIAAGFVLFGEELPQGLMGALQLAAFAALIASAVLLARGPLPQPSSQQRDRPRALHDVRLFQGRH